MKLKTKFQDEDFELGEVVDATISVTPLDEHIKVKAKGKHGREHFFNFSRISELFELFEDYEGPKEYYAIDLQGDTIKWARHSWDEKTTNKIKEIGNYFESKEEAEQAVKKLKAWKRVKRDLVSLHWQRERDGNFSVWGEFKTGNTLRADVFLDNHSEDLDLLFGGEE